MSKRVAVYARVSTSRQAEADISIPDQLDQARDYCEKRGWHVVEEFVDPGASARDDKRPEFQRMIEAACVDPSPFDCVLVHSFSRFFRDSAGSAIYGSKLSGFGVTVLSMTQEVGEGPQAKLMRSILSAFDAYQSDETAKHVTRSMKANAREGFWNGAQPPFGYATKVVERRGGRDKKVLVEEPKEAAVVRRIFRLYLEGDGGSGPMGVKEIAKWLSAHGHATRRGGAFYTSHVHKKLCNEAYAGAYHYNQRDTATKKIRPREEWITVAVPPLIDRKTFDRVQAALRRRSPKITPPRQTKSSVLLTGLAHCAPCRSKMMLRTGKSGQYRYYTCARKAVTGGCDCRKPISVRMDALDETVCTELAQRLLTPERMRPIVRETIARVRDRKSAALGSVRTLNRELRKIEGQIENLVDQIATGGFDSIAPLKAGLSKREQRRAELLRLIGTEKRRADLPPQTLSNAQIDRYCDALRRALLNGPHEFRKAYLNLIVSEIVVDRDEIRISGSKAALAAATLRSKTESPEKVLTSVREWRAGEDSNPRPPDS